MIIEIWRDGEIWKQILTNGALEAGKLLQLMIAYGVEDDEGGIWQVVEQRVDLGSEQSRLEIWIEVQ